MVQVYAEPLARRHYGRWFGEAMLFRFLVLVASVILSLIVAYATGGFWVIVQPNLTQATVHYTYDALLLFQGNTGGSDLVWSTSSVINTGFAANYVAASVQASEIDVNGDGKPDIIDFQATVQSMASQPIYSVKALLQFTYLITGPISLSMYSLAYMSASSPAPGGALFTDGQLELQQLDPIKAKLFNGIYNVPMLNSTAPAFPSAVLPSVNLEFQEIIKSYLTRNYTTTYTNFYPVWQPGKPNSFELNMRIRIPPNQVVLTRPQVLNNLKVGWIQFLATFLFIAWLLSWFEYFIFHFRLLNTRMVSDLQTRAHRF